MLLPDTPPSREHAILHVGAASISLIIGTRLETGGFSLLEHLDRPLALARDIFRGGVISRSTVEQAAGILKDYQSSLREYGVSAAHTRLHATNILAEAVNHEIFLNRLQVTTGLAARLMDDGDMTRFIYQVSQRLFQANPALREGHTFVTHIGPGNTRALYFKAGRLAAYSNYRLGIFRARARVAVEEGDAPRQLSHLEEHIRGVVDHLAADYSGYTTEHHVAIGAEIQSVAAEMTAAKNGLRCILERDLERVAGKLALLSPDEMVRKLHVHYTGAEGVVPALQTNLALPRRVGEERLWVPEGDFQRELMLDLATAGPRLENFQDEVIQAACEIGVRYKTDRKHADHVAAFAQQLFRELQHLHGLDAKYELVLRVAALLHEVGMFISPREHHKHSLYILLQTEIFGLSSGDRVLVALLARYHRRYNPEPNHPHFADLSREERMIVFKLAALLRIADALDRTHAQRVKSILIRPDGGRLHILTPGVDDTTVEQIAINSKCGIFSEIYGYEVVLSRP